MEKRVFVEPIAGRCVATKTSADLVCKKLVLLLTAPSVVSKQDLVVLDFDGVDVQSSTFLVALVENLIENHNPALLRDCLRFESMTHEARKLFHRVTLNAVAFADNDELRKAITALFEGSAQNKAKQS
jgi:hypothetical protein